MKIDLGVESGMGQKIVDEIGCRNPGPLGVPGGSFLRQVWAYVPPVEKGKRG